MATKRKTTKKTSPEKCKVTFEVSRAGHLLKTRGSSRAGKVLATEGKSQKAKRRAKGCLNGLPGTFKLSAKQKRNLPKNLQKAIISHHRRLGKRIIN